MWVRMKHRWASCGVQTIGSPRTLNEVFTSTGQPVSRSNSTEQIVIIRVVFPRDGLNPRGVIDMGDRGDIRARNVQLIDSPETALLIGHRDLALRPYRRH